MESAQDAIERTAGERWYVVACKAQQERTAEIHLGRQRFPVYLPLIRVRRRLAGIHADRIEPLFPSYLFLLVDLSKRSTTTVRSTRGVIDFIRLSREPTPIETEIVEEIRAREINGVHVDPSAEIIAGEPVRVAEGPLAGLEGIYSQREGKHRAAILLSTIGRTRRVIVKRDWIERIAA